MSEDLQSWATLAVSVSVACVGVAQWWTARNKLRLDLFEKRWKVYDAVRSVMAKILADTKCGRETQNAYLRDIQGVGFLFDDKIRRYLYEDFWKKMCHLELTASMLEASEGVEHLKIVDDKWKTLQWFNEQSEVIFSMFGEYLRIDEGFFSWIWRKYGPRP